MNGIMKGMLIAFMIMYVVSPIDLCPGPVDDIIIILMTLVANKRENNISD